MYFTTPRSQGKQPKISTTSDTHFQDFKPRGP